MAALAPGDLLLVVSGYGMEPLTPVKRILERLVGNAEVSGTHERAPDGFLMAYGSGGAPGPPGGGDASSTSRRRCSISWACRSAATWTASRAPILFAADFTEARPVTFIPTYGR